MDYLKLVAGILVLLAFGWILVKNANRRGFLHAFFRFDTLVGLIAGIYLVISSVA